MKEQSIKIGMAELGATKSPSKLITTGLGSCVGICLYDNSSKVGGLAHIMLPDSKQARAIVNTAKYADTAIPLLIEEMVKLGANKSKLIAKIAGGAQMFNFAGTSSIMRIGERNTEAVLQGLQKENIRVIAQDTGGSYGRTIELNAENGNLYIKTIHLGEKVV